MWVFFEILYGFMIFYGSLLVICSSSWFVIWFGFELNMVSFIVFFGSKNKVSLESLFKYFFVQVIGSVFMLFFCVLFSLSGISDFLMGEYYLMDNIMFLVMVWKLGGGPFFFWMPAVVEGLSWFGNFVLMTWQKIAPLWIIGLMSFNQMLVVLIGFYSVLIGCFGGLNQLLMSSIFVYSSISHMGWMFFMSSISFYVMILYYIFYVILSGSLILFFLNSEKVHVNQLYLMKVDLMLMVIFFMGLFSLGGLPPLLGVYPKWLGLLLLLDFGYVFFCFFLLLLGVISLYYYLRLGYGWILFMNYSCDWVVGFNKFSLMNLILINFSCFFMFYFSLVFV
uniref:NADH-ubiquinone oxidoreductase chain 2 n=1 Tax=Epanerchodus koreanus TaxID=2678661 RepID=A0A7L8HYX6_9MYRI|nr:NADH dehydrogenase subunit 2 [Epanerchodus koreanus]QOE55889.1 NADH dehydrogenase subunit 2 [Epanerchodus koreanus]